MARPFPELLSPEESKELLETAERVWRELQANQLGGFSGVNRPFWILAEFKTVIEKYGHRDIGQTWTKNELDAARARGDDKPKELPEIEAEGIRLVNETYKPKDGGYLWTDVVGCVQTAIAEERARHGR